jgi:DNA-binding CsgD family transcriptional regulator
MEQNNSLEFLVRTYFSHYQNTSIVLNVLDLNGDLQYSTINANILLNSLNCSTERNNNYFQILENSNFCSQEAIDKLKLIFNNTINKKTNISYIMALRSIDADRDHSNIWHCIQMPIMNNLEMVIGVQIVCESFSYIPLENLIFNRDIKYDLNQLRQFNLTAKQHQVLFLLCNSFTQEEIAAILQVTRGTITRMIVDQIALKLGVSVANAYNVVQRAKQLGFQYITPNELFNDSIIILNP